ncbi:unnamed protein product [Lepidochelys kempii]
MRHLSPSTTAFTQHHLAAPSSRAWGQCLPKQRRLGAERRISVEESASSQVPAAELSCHQICTMPGLPHCQLDAHAQEQRRYREPHFNSKELEVQNRRFM